MRDNPMEKHHLQKVEEYVHQKNEKEFFFLKSIKRWLLLSDGKRARA